MVLDDIKTVLTTAAVVNGDTWRCFIGFCPDTQDQVVSLHLTGGAPQNTHGGENASITFQVRVRTARKEYSACYTKWKAVLDALHDADLSAYGIRLIQAMAMAPLEFYDEKERPNMTANFTVLVDWL